MTDSIERIDLTTNYLLPIQKVVCCIPNPEHVKWMFRSSATPQGHFDVAGRDEKFIIEAYRAGRAISTQQLLGVNFKKTQLINCQLAALSEVNDVLLSIDYVDSSFVVVRSKFPQITKSISSAIRSLQRPAGDAG